MQLVPQVSWSHPLAGALKTTVAACPFTVTLSRFAPPEATEYAHSRIWWSFVQGRNPPQQLEGTTPLTVTSLDASSCATTDTMAVSVPRFFTPHDTEIAEILIGRPLSRRTGRGDPRMR